MAGADGFRTAPLGFDKNDVNNYISKLVQRLKSAEEEKNESNALASKAKEMKEHYESRISELEEAKKTYQENTEKEIKEYKLTIEELDIKVVALLSEMEQRRVSNPSNGSDANAKTNADEIIKQAKYQANEIIEKAKRERQSVINSTHYLLNTISLENKAINSAFYAIKKGLSKCVNADIDADFELIDDAPATQTIDVQTAKAVTTEVVEPVSHASVQYASVEEVQPIAETASIQVEVAQEPVQVEKASLFQEDLEDIFAVKDVSDDSLNDEILDFTQLKKVESSTESNIDDDLSGLFAVPEQAPQGVNTSDFDVVVDSPHAEIDFVDMMIKEDVPSSDQPACVEDDLSLFFSAENPDDDVADATVDFTQMDTGIDENTFEIKPLEPDANMFDSLWSLSADDEDDEMSSDNVGIMDL